MMVVDLMHEFELGVWKALFTHLIRILHAASKGQPGALADVLNARYTQPNTVGGEVLTPHTGFARFLPLVDLRSGDFITMSQR